MWAGSSNWASRRRLVGVRPLWRHSSFFSACLRCLSSLRIDQLQLAGRTQQDIGHLRDAGRGLAAMPVQLELQAELEALPA